MHSSFAPAKLVFAVALCVGYGTSTLSLSLLAKKIDLNRVCVEP